VRLRSRDSQRGFTLVEVLIALAITAVVSTLAYSSLSAVVNAVDSIRESVERTSEINRAWMIISRDINHFVTRPVRDEFGDEEPALVGGPAARFTLSLTRTGWHNFARHPRSNMERVNYRLEDEALWRDSYPVLDRVADSEPREVLLLQGVEYLELRFLATLGQLQFLSDSSDVDTRNWAENWVLDSSVPGTRLLPPVAIEVRLQLDDIGEMRRLYALPPI